MIGFEATPSQVWKGCAAVLTDRKALTMDVGTTLLHREGEKVARVSATDEGASGRMG